MNNQKGINRSKSRGKFLTVVIIMSAFSLLYSNLPNALKDIHNSPHDPLSLYWMANTVLNAIALIGIWLWKKWAVYMLFIVYAIQLVASVIIAYRSYTFMLIFLLAFAFIYGLWIWALSRKWYLFS